MLPKRRRRRVRHRRTTNSRRPCSSSSCAAGASAVCVAGWSTRSSTSELGELVESVLQNAYERRSPAARGHRARAARGRRALETWLGTHGAHRQGAPARRPARRQGRAARRRRPNAKQSLILYKTRRSGDFTRPLAGARRHPGRARHGRRAAAHGVLRRVAPRRHQHRRVDGRVRRRPAAQGPVPPVQHPRATPTTPRRSTRCSAAGSPTSTSDATAATSPPSPTRAQESQRRRTDRRRATKKFAYRPNLLIVDGGQPQVAGRGTGARGVRGQRDPAVRHRQAARGDLAARTPTTRSSCRATATRCSCSSASATRRTASRSRYQRQTRKTRHHSRAGRDPRARPGAGEGAAASTSARSRGCGPATPAEIAEVKGHRTRRSRPPIVEHASRRRRAGASVGWSVDRHERRPNDDGTVPAAGAADRHGHVRRRSIDGRQRARRPRLVRRRQPAAADAAAAHRSRRARRRRNLPKIAAVVDVRGGKLFAELQDVVERSAPARIVRVVFLEATDAVLVRRFEQVRRPHPLQGDGTLLDGIAAERARMVELREPSDIVIDTSDLNIHQLATAIAETFAEAGHPGRAASRCSASASSTDCRPTPTWWPTAASCRTRSGCRNCGRSPARTRRSRLRARPGGREEFIDGYAAALEPVLAGYQRENKRHATIAIGCTGGKHRSVAIAEELADRLCAAARASPSTSSTAISDASRRRTGSADDNCTKKGIEWHSPPTSRTNCPGRGRARQRSGRPNWPRSCGSPADCTSSPAASRSSPNSTRRSSRAGCARTSPSCTGCAATCR